MKLVIFSLRATEDFDTRDLKEAKALLEEFGVITVC
jgi:hypothetical protein